MKQPQIWHHGLVAFYWAEFQKEASKEVNYFSAMITNSGEPALDLGCGSGRLLMPLLQSGFYVDGCDYSEDMLARCQERAAKEGFTPGLYQQAMHELDLPRRYRTIFSCGVIGLGGQRKLTQKAMGRCYEHLRSGGVFVFDYAPKWNDPPAWLSRLPEGRQALPGEWRTSSRRNLLADGSELELATRTLATDPLEEVATRQIRVRHWRNGEVLQEEVHTQKLDDYSKNELILMLEYAGFSDIQVQGDYNNKTATADDRNLVFVARK